MRELWNSLGKRPVDLERRGKISRDIGYNTCALYHSEAECVA